MDNYGAGTRNRTQDLLITSQLLYQLSYASLKIEDQVYKRWSFGNKILAMTYFHMGRPHTIIGARLFHF